MFIFFSYLLEIITNDIRSIIFPTISRFICIYRVARHINLTTPSIVVKHKSAPCWRSCRLAIYTCQRGATIECFISNRSHAIADCNTFQRGATRECLISNRSNAIRNSDTCKAAARRKCSLSNRSNAIRNCNTCQRGAITVFTTSYYSIFCE